MNVSSRHLQVHMRQSMRRITRMVPTNPTAIASTKINHKGSSFSSTSLTVGVVGDGSGIDSPMDASPSSSYGRNTNIIQERIDVNEVL